MQLEAVKEMLSLSADDDDVEHKTVKTWKVLIYDDEAKMILAPILKVGQLRKLGVTINMSINETREQIPGVDAVYLVSPKRKNIDVILKDAKNGKYNQIHINFTTSTSDDYLSTLAREFVEHGGFEYIASVTDRYLHFISISQRIFSLNIPLAFSTLYGDATEQSGSEMLDLVVDRLCSVIVTLNCLPVIRSPGSMSPANIIAERLNSRLYELVTARNKLGISLVNTFNRPMLVILDRNVDLGAMIQHSWTYQPLMHDIFGIHYNKVTIDSGQKKLSFELESNDKIYQSIQRLPLNDVAIDIASSLESYNSQISQINKGYSTTTGNIVNTMNAIPQLTEQKRLLDMHTNMATALVDAVKEREIDRCYEYQCDLPYISDKNVMNNFEEILRSKATPMDMYRCLLLMALAKPDWPESRLDEYEQRINAIGNVGCEALVGIRNVLKMRAFSENLMKQVENATRVDLTTAKSIIDQNNQSATTKEVSSSHKRLANYSSKLIDTGLSIFKGVKNLLPRKKEMYLVTLLENLINNTSNVADEFLTFDPKVSQSVLPKSIRKPTAKDCIVFVVGGGSYTEAGAIHDLGTRLKHTMIYGSTFFDRPQEFIMQLGSFKNSF
ncbi:bifunctional Sec1-like protein/Sec1-like [Babesia duncani]|nr:bifunctional Sec1-like protein/Sec1-like [Babesia duncani]